MELSTAVVSDICKRAGFYSTPDLNERLYLQCKGICEIQGLDAFVHAKAVWLEGNCISELRGLEHNTEVLSLYLARNTIREITGLDNMACLAKLDLADNLISSVRGLEGCRSLQDVNLAKNNLKTKADVLGLLACTDTLSSVDLSGNPLGDPGVLDVLAALPHLASLRLQGTQLSKTLPACRKTLIVRLPRLRALDDTPVTDVDRNAAAAFLSGGCDAERRVRADARAAEEARNAGQAARFDAMVEDARRRRAAGAPRAHSEYYAANHGAAAVAAAAAGGRRVCSVSEEVVEGVCGVEDEMRVRDAMRQGSLRPRTEVEAAGLVGGNAARRAAEEAAAAAAQTESDVGVGSDWASDDCDAEAEEEARLRVARDEGRLARDRRAAERRLRRAPAARRADDAGGVCSGAQELARRAIARAAGTGAVRVEEEEEVDAAENSGAQDDVCAAGAGGGTEEDYLTRKLREQAEESAWAQGVRGGRAEVEVEVEVEVEGKKAGPAAAAGSHHVDPFLGGDVEALD